MFYSLEPHTIKSDKLDFIFKDILGSLVCTVDVNGNLKDSFVYEPFGRMLDTANNSGASKSTTLVRSFTGHFAEDDEGLYYCHARWYDADIGRFLQADSVLDGFNRYAYCHNNPTGFVDPSGEYIVNSASDMMSDASDEATLGSGTGKIKDIGCTLTSYVRMANALGAHTSLEHANEFAKENNLFTGDDKNELSINNGVNLVNGLLKEAGVNASISYDQSDYADSTGYNNIYKGYQEHEESEAPFFANARIGTSDSNFEKFYDHTVSLNDGALVKDNCCEVPTNLRIRDTSPTGRTMAHGDSAGRAGSLRRTDYFNINSPTITSVDYSDKGRTEHYSHGSEKTYQ